MAKLPDLLDPTLEAVNRAIESRDNGSLGRPYLGMSQIGNACRRMLWLSFRWCTPAAFDAATLKRFEDGHRTEDLEAVRLRLVEGVELHTVDPATGRQFGVADHGGHFRGHLDGAIRGLIQAPKTWHVWECKSVNEKKQAELAKAKQEHGEKDALEAWDETYFAQAQCYLHYTGMTRHYLTCTTPGGRHTISVRTEYQQAKALHYIGRALSVIQAPEPLERISNDPAYYLCKWCGHHDACHGQRLVSVTCRTCCHATPEMDGDGRWTCARHKKDLSVKDQQAACPDHVYIPALVSHSEMTDASEAENWVEYKVKATGKTYRNGAQYWSSQELQVTDPAMIGEPVVEELRQTMGAKVVGGAHG